MPKDTLDQQKAKAKKTVDHLFAGHVKLHSSGPQLMRQLLTMLGPLPGAKMNPAKKEEAAKEAIASAISFNVVPSSIPGKVPAGPKPGS